MAKHSSGYEAALALLHDPRVDVIARTLFDDEGLYLPPTLLLPLGSLMQAPLDAVPALESVPVSWLESLRGSWASVRRHERPLRAAAEALATALAARLQWDEPGPWSTCRRRWLEACETGGWDVLDEEEKLAIQQTHDFAEVRRLTLVELLGPATFFRMAAPRHDESAWLHFPLQLHPGAPAHFDVDVPAGARGGRSPREERTPFGVFEERSRGPLPEDLGRLAPQEMVYQVMDEEEARLLFSIRAAEGQLLQRYGHRSAHARRRARVLLVLDLHESAELHRLRPAREDAWWQREPPCFFGREIFWELLARACARSADDEGLRVSICLRYWGPDATETGADVSQWQLLTDHEVHDLPREPRELARTLRRLVPTGLLDLEARPARDRRHAPLPAQVDLLGRILVGPPSAVTSLEDGLPTQCRVGRGLRVAVRSGRRIEVGEGRVSELSRLDTPSQWREGVPEQIARALLARVFGAESEERGSTALEVHEG